MPPSHSLEPSSSGSKETSKIRLHSVLRKHLLNLPLLLALGSLTPVEKRSESGPSRSLLRLLLRLGLRLWRLRLRMWLRLRLRLTLLLHLSLGHCRLRSW